MADKSDNLKKRVKGDRLIVATPATYAVIVISLLAGPMTVSDIVLASRASRQSVYSFLRVLREAGLLRFAGKTPDRHGRLSIPAWEISPEEDAVHTPRMATEDYKLERTTRKRRREKKRRRALKQWARQHRDDALHGIEHGSSERDAQIEFLYRLSGVFDKGSAASRPRAISETIRGGSAHLLREHNCTQVQTSQENGNGKPEVDHQPGPA